MSAAVSLRAPAAVMLLAISVAGGCQLTARALGEDCLKDQDCLSGICSQLKCAPAPPLLQSVPEGSPQDAGAPPPEDAAPEAAAREAGGIDSAADVAAQVDSSSPALDSSVDSAADSSAADSSAADAPSE